VQSRVPRGRRYRIIAASYAKKVSQRLLLTDQPKFALSSAAARRSASPSVSGHTGKCFAPNSILSGSRECAQDATPQRGIRRGTLALLLVACPYWSLRMAYCCLSILDYMFIDYYLSYWQKPGRKYSAVPHVTVARPSTSFSEPSDTMAAVFPLYNSTRQAVDSLCVGECF
jgi:hypothetical protein